MLKKTNFRSKIKSKEKPNWTREYFSVCLRFILFTLSFEIQSANEQMLSGDEKTRQDERKNIMSFAFVHFNVFMWIFYITHLINVFFFFYTMYVYLYLNSLNVQKSEKNNNVWNKKINNGRMNWNLPKTPQFKWKINAKIIDSIHCFVNGDRFSCLPNMFDILKSSKFLFFYIFLYSIDRNGMFPRVLSFEVFFILFVFAFPFLSLLFFFYFFLSSIVYFSLRIDANNRRILFFFRLCVFYVCSFTLRRFTFLLYCHSKQSTDSFYLFTEWRQPTYRIIIIMKKKKFSLLVLLILTLHL